MANAQNSAWLFRRLIVAATAVALAIGVVKISLARVVDTSNPALALTINANDARAMAAQAERLAQPEASRTELARADELARKALSRDATIAPAIRTLGLAADLGGDRERAAALFRFAARTSFRDLPSQLWLIQYAVERDDAAGALNHFDIALRASHRSATMLFPVLVSATEDDRLLDPISDVLARRPWWGGGYLVSLVSNGKATDNIVALFRRLTKKRVSITAEATMLLTNRLVTESRYLQAFEINRIHHPETRVGVLQNGGFERDILPAFDWVLQDAPNLRSERVSGSNGTIALGFYVAAGSTGSVARQLVVLPPGTYSIKGVATLGEQSESGRVELDVTCARSIAPATVETGLSLVSREAGAARLFNVPPKKCPAVWVDIIVNAANSATAIDGEIDTIELTKA